MAMKMVPGKIYLRDRRNGNEYEYERHLAQSKHVDAFTYEAPEAKPAVPPKPSAAEKKAAAEKAAAEAKTDAAK